MEVLRNPFRGLELRAKLTLALLAGTLAIGLLVTLAAYLLTRQQLTEQAEALLEARVQREKREIELRLANLLELAESLAGNSITANGLADPLERENYLAPLLHTQKLPVAAADLSVVDLHGKALVSSRTPLPDFAAMPGSGQITHATRTRALLLDDTGHASMLVVALPIARQQTGNRLGSVILRIPLASLIASGGDIDARFLADGLGKIHAGQPYARPSIARTARLDLPAPLDQAGLQLILAKDRAKALAFLQHLLLVFIAVGALVVLGVTLFARAGARFITASLREIAAAAEAIATQGRPGTRLPIRRHDEFGRLSAAFNTMVDRLAASYAELEQRVLERTREYEASRREAEKASQLLREAVHSIAQGFTIYDEHDRLVLCNEAYRSFYADSSDLITPGASFAEIVRKGAERGQYAEAIGCIDDWVERRVAQHQNACGEVLEQKLGDGRWLLIVEHRTPSGYIVGNRIDITELKRTTEALRQRELYLRATIDNLPFFFWLKDEESRFLAVNKVFADACGQPSPEAVSGLSDYDVWPTDLAERYRADDFEVIRSGCAKALEEPVAGGSAAGWIETYKKPVIAPDGRILGTVGFARDISERKHMQQALADSEQRWELALKGANDGVWDWNVQSGELYFSERWKSMLGFADDELAGRFEVWHDLLHPDDRTRVEEDVHRHFAGSSAFYESEFRLRCKDGSYKWILSRGKAIFNPLGEPIRMSGSHTDISERRAADARNHDHLAQLDAIFALSPDGFVSFDAAYHVKYANPAFLKMIGVDAGEVIGQDEAGFAALVDSVCLPQTPFSNLAALRSGGLAASSGGTQHIQLELATPGRRVLEAGLRQSDGESVSQILYFRDITHESEVDRMKSEFLSTAAHELRTPMASIYGFTELLITQALTEEERSDFLQTIFAQSELMIAIINELLDLSRIEARRGKDFVIERLDACALVEAVLAGYKLPPGRSPALRPNCHGPRWLRGDRQKLTQAISNVLSNAYKYSPAGGDIEIRFNEAGEVHGLIGIRISDPGIGMTPQQLARVCERFYRADTSGAIPGTGLGMSIVKEIVELLGGKLEITSTPQQGTRVTLWLPAAPPPEHLPTPADRTSTPADQDLQPRLPSAVAAIDVSKDPA